MKQHRGYYLKKKNTSDKMLAQLNISQEFQSWDSLSQYDKLKDIKVIEKPEVLFARLEAELEIEAIKEMMR